MIVIRLELDVPDDKAAELARALLFSANTICQDRELTAPRVTLLSEFEVQREKTLLAAAQYFYPPAPGAGHGR